MRCASFMLVSGFLLGAGATAAFFQGNVDREAKVKAHASARAASAGPGEESTNEVEDLRARIADLEGALERARALAARVLGAGSEASAAGGAPPEAGAVVAGASEPSQADLELLYALVDRGDAAGLRREVLRLLRAGKKGYETLTDFFYGELYSPRQALFNSRPLLAALAGLAFENGPEMAGLARHLLDAGDELKDARLNGKLRALLPSFLAYHRGRFGDLEAAFAERLIDELAQEGDVGLRFEALAAMDELGMAAPAEILAALLANPGDEGHYRRLLQHILKHQGPAGVDLLADFLEGARDQSHWSVRLALHTLGRMGLPEAQEVLARFGRGAGQGAREVAEIASRSGSVEDALAYLNSGAELARKRALVKQLASAEPELLEELKLERDGIGSDEVRSMLEHNGNDGELAVLIAGTELLITEGQSLDIVLPTGVLFTGASFSPDGKLLTTAADGTARFWDVTTGKLMADVAEMDVAQARAQALEQSLMQEAQAAFAQAQQAEQQAVVQEE